jgi:relaxase-like protein
MAVVKNNYIPKGKTAFAKAKQTLLYNETRKGRDKEKIILSLFNHDGEISEEQAIQFLQNKPKDWYYWRIMISPDPGEKEDLQKDLDMRELTKKTIQSIEAYLKMEGEINFVAALHTDRAHRHVHAIIYLPRVTQEQFAALSSLPRYAATEEALSQRHILEAHQELHQSVERVYQQSRSTEYQRPVGMAGGRARRGMKPVKERIGCQQCSYKNSMVKLKSGKYWCQTCGKVREREAELSL